MWVETTSMTQIWSYDIRIHHQKLHTASDKRNVFGFPKNRLRSSSDIWRISRPLRTWLKNIICQWFFGNSGASNKRKWYDMVPAGLFIVYDRVNVVSCFFGWPGKRWVVTEELCIVLMGSLPLNTLWDASPNIWGITRIRCARVLRWINHRWLVVTNFTV